jgi:hypothetical protein
MSIHVLGIRHHGPGSAANVRSFLIECKPDLVLIEGPPEADGILNWAADTELQPPVAILCYQPEDPGKSVFYPFATFSPEWQAILYARQNKIPVRFFDLPVSNQVAVEKEGPQPKEKDNLTSTQQLNDVAVTDPPGFDVRKDPISYLAEAAGYEEGEKWWEQMFEYRKSTEQVFEAVSTAMDVLRKELRLKPDRLEKLREAYMRKMIRQAEREMFSNVAVICGAWHVPALTNMGKQKDDNEILKGLPKVKIECTWIPWTYNRLSYYSGYGAGIHSPGWYEHIWTYPDDDGTRWMSKIAHLFRKKGMDTSVAHVIEAVRLAETLASLRGFPKAGLEELNEAALTVLCNGDAVLLQLINEELIVGHEIGKVPEDIPKPPLQVDIEKLQKSLRLSPTADYKDYTLDLRKELDLARSIFLHRLRLLEIKWGYSEEISGKGTFKEQWRLQWDPAFSIDIIEKGTWGNTVEAAANSYVIEQAKETKSLLSLSAFLKDALPAELHAAVQVLIEQLNNLAAASGDTVELIEAVPALVDIARYGNVRNTDTELVLLIVTSMITRVCVGLPNAVTGIDEDAAQNLAEKISELHDAISVLQQEDLTMSWQQTLQRVSSNENTAPVVSGYATRLLSDYRILQGEQLLNIFHFRMSTANMPGITAAWLEGFLKGSGSILLIDNELWMLVHDWVATLNENNFSQVLPLLRRTFSNFTSSERRKLGEKVKSGGAATGIKILHVSDVDDERGKKGVDVVLKLFGIK